MGNRIGWRHTGADGDTYTRSKNSYAHNSNHVNSCADGYTSPDSHAGQNGDTDQNSNPGPDRYTYPDAGKNSYAYVSQNSYTYPDKDGDTDS